MILYKARTCSIVFENGDGWGWADLIKEYWQANKRGKFPKSQNRENHNPCRRGWGLAKRSIYIYSFNFTRISFFHFHFFYILPKKWGGGGYYMIIQFFICKFNKYDCCEKKCVCVYVCVGGGEGSLPPNVMCLYTWI